MRFSALALVIAALSIIGCAAGGPKYEHGTPLESAASEIVVYRPDRFARGGNTFLIYLDGKEVARLQNAGFATIPASPGAHELEIRGPALLLNFKPMTLRAITKAGARSYFRFEPYASGGVVVLPTVISIPVSYSFDPIPEFQALVELRELKRSD